MRSPFVVMIVCFLVLLPQRICGCGADVFACAETHHASHDFQFDASLSHLPLAWQSLKTSSLPGDSDNHEHHECGCVNVSFDRDGTQPSAKGTIVDLNGLYSMRPIALLLLDMRPQRESNLRITGPPRYLLFHILRN